MTLKYTLFPLSNVEKSTPGPHQDHLVQAFDDSLVSPQLPPPLRLLAPRDVPTDAERSNIPSSECQKVNEAYERVLKSDVRYRFVIDNGIAWQGLKSVDLHYVDLH